MKELFHILKEIQDSPHRKALSTIINVEGSAYQKEGTMMLIQEDGPQIGLISGGCLDNDLVERAKSVWNTGNSCIVTYDLSTEDDLSFGQRSGCSGLISVLLEPVDNDLKTHLGYVQECLYAGKSVLHVKKLSESGSLTAYMFLTQDDRFFGRWTDEFPMNFKTILSENKKVAMMVSKEYYAQLLRPKPRLIIFGAGPDARPLVSFASHTGFSVTVIDWRPAICNQTHLPEADHLFVDFQKALSDFSFLPSDSVIIMTHNFAKDKEILHILLYKKLKYLGLLGSKSRTTRLLAGKEKPDWLHTPVGLSIGAEGPEEIAISILAEVIQTLRKEEHFG